MKRVLIIRSGAVGDLILTLPVLSALKNRYDGLSIDMMGDPVRLSLLKQCGYVDKVLSVDDRRYTPLFGSHASPADVPAIRTLRSYDAILSYLPDSTGAFVKNLRRVVASPVLTGHSHPDVDDTTRRIHITHLLMKALSPLGVDPVAGVPELRPPLHIVKTDSRRESSYKPLIAVHPGSGGRKKCWPADRYVTLIGTLVDRGFEPIATFGPADGVIRSLTAPGIERVGGRFIENQSLADLTMLLSRCQAMIGNDSGITHLAAALGIHVVALFGPTDPAVWGPRGRSVRILWGDQTIEGDVGAIAWHDASSARCLEDITVVSVLDEVEKLVAKD